MMFILSLLLHLVIIFVCTRAELFRAELHEATPYYVDIVSLPVIEPASGVAPTPPKPATSLPAAPPPASAPSRPAMSLPAKSATAQKHTPASQPASDSSGQEAREFNERLNRLERAAEARHQAAALESLQKKAAVNAKPGAPSATGASPGYDYAAYIQSRLRDALASTMVYRSKQPEAFVHLYIDKKGKLLRYVMEKPSSDKLFNDSVMRTIEKAKAYFPPNPAGTDFDKLYAFSPQEVSKK
ncbi:MAG TPA: TonB C-terminal domain-containing protein [Geobacteraceae bacterium]|nr:TonB C-terminal domain-containing protein [Geobacteraceae bacterium]